MSCTHLGTVRVLAANAVAHIDECTKCFDNSQMPVGINVCLTCFNGGCPGRGHDILHYRRFNHPVVLNMKKRLVLPDSEALKEITKLGVGVPGGADLIGPKYTYVTNVHCLACKRDVPITEGKLQAAVDAVLKYKPVDYRDDGSTPFVIEVQPCEHTLTLAQAMDAPVLASKALAHCQSCDLSSNLWLCLTCGALGCGRAQKGGQDGRGHALAHATSTKHPLVCKLGTITAEGTGAVYCYSCNDSVVDPHLADHLSHFGINVATQMKTEKTQEEMELEAAKKMNFSGADSGGKPLKLLRGPRMTGLVNIGNSCYMASVFQLLFSIPQFQDRYGSRGVTHLADCKTQDSASCWHCQIAKLADGILSGRYSGSDSPAEVTDAAAQNVPVGITPRMAANLITRDHAEFRTKKQQDADQFLSYFLEQIDRQEHAAGSTPTSAITFEIEQRLECQECHHVSYKTQRATAIDVPIPVAEELKVTMASMAVPTNEAAPSVSDTIDPVKAAERAREREQNAKASAAFREENKIQVPFMTCLNSWAADDVVSGYQCPVCGHATKVVNTARFKTFPDTLLVHVKRFVFDDWVPRKVGVDVSVPLSKIDVSLFRGKGLQPGEKQMPQATAPAAAAKAQPNASMLADLMAMGFGKNLCTRALLAVENAGIEPAMNWVMAHMDDPGANDPLPADDAGSGSVNEESAAMICSMGFERDAAVYALKQTSGNVERACDWLFSHQDDLPPLLASGAGKANVSTAPKPTITGDDRPPVYQLCAFINHLGSSSQTGHYIAHVLIGDQWVGFNDEKVYVPETLPASQAYIYMFRKVAP